MELAPKFQPDVILLDIGLPDMSGWELARAFRGNSVLCRARIIAISGNRTDADKLQSKAAGIDVHLGKPVHYGEVLRAWRK